ncbi:uncharacterized protein isoform X2 [Rhodnius prolixus]|uniref:uncharacterized protein isoform X2 n=1 Tax=Rhodnius prolixus TaxID=13249 RepID=UPI003D18D3D7
MAFSLCDLETLSRGPFALNNLVSKDEFFNLTKNVIYAVDTHSNDEGISTPICHRTSLRSSTPASTNLSFTQSQFKYDSLQTQQISPISRSNISRQRGYLTLANINDSLEKRLSVAESNLQLLEEKLKNEKEINLKITKDFESLREEVKRLWNSEEQLLEANEKLKSLDIKYRTALNDLLRARDSAENSDAQNNYLQKENIGLNNDILKKTLKLNRLEECNHSLTNEILSLKEIVERLKIEVNQLKSRENVLNDRIEQLKNEKQELRLLLMENEKSPHMDSFSTTYTSLYSMPTSGTSYNQDLPPNGSNVPNNSPPSLMMELSSVTDDKFGGGLLSSSSESLNGIKEFSDKYVQTDLVKYVDVGVNTCLDNSCVEEKKYCDKGIQTIVPKFCDAGVSVLPSPSEQLLSTRGTQTERLENQENRRYSADENTQSEELNTIEAESEGNHSRDSASGDQEYNQRENDSNNNNNNNNNKDDEEIVEDEELLEPFFNDSLELSLNYSFQILRDHGRMESSNWLAEVEPPSDDGVATPSISSRAHLETLQIQSRELSEFIQLRVTSSNISTETELEDNDPEVPEQRVFSDSSTVGTETRQFPIWDASQRSFSSSDDSRLSDPSILCGLITLKFIKRLIFWSWILTALMILFAAFMISQPYCVNSRGLGTTRGCGNCYTFWDWMRSYLIKFSHKHPPPV